MPLVSVIVPVYKVEQVVKNCIESILNQTFTNFELILVDDGSPDNSGKICDEYAQKDDRVIVIHKENGGVSSARNVGIDKAKGKYICFVDSDDYVSKDYLKTLIDVEENNNADNIWCYFKSVDKYSEKIDCKEVSSEPNIEKYTVKDIMTLHEKWLDAGPVCKLYISDIIKENNLKFDESLSLGEDLIFNFVYLDYTNKNIIVINNELYFYLQNNENSLSKKYYQDMFEIYKKINSVMYQYLNKWNCDKSQFGKYYNSCFFKYEVVLKNTFSNQNNVSDKEKIKINNKILKSKEFTMAINNMSYKPNILYKIAYLCKNYRIVKIIEFAFRLLGRNRTDEE